MPLPLSLQSNSYNQARLLSLKKFSAGAAGDIPEMAYHSELCSGEQETKQGDHHQGNGLLNMEDNSMK